jgi:ribonuclease HIII
MLNEIVHKQILLKKKLQYLSFKNSQMLQNNYSEFILETGTDEAGRGCLAGPVTAAAVILPLDFKNEILNEKN